MLKRRPDEVVRVRGAIPSKIAAIPPAAAAATGRERLVDWVFFEVRIRPPWKRSEFFGLDKESGKGCIVIDLQPPHGMPCKGIRFFLLSTDDPVLKFCIRV